MTFIKHAYKKPHGLHNSHISITLKITKLNHPKEQLITLIQFLFIHQRVPPRVKKSKSIATFIQVFPLRHNNK